MTFHGYTALARTGLNCQIRFSRFLLPPANEVWGKVIFSQASVILSTGGGGMHPGDPPPPSTTGYGQQAGGTHPIGMYSGLNINMSHICNWYVINAF